MNGPLLSFLYRLRDSGRDYRYGGFRAWLQWVFRGIAADEED
jgi:hypothetical protein